MHKIKKPVKQARSMGNTVLSICAAGIMAAAWIGTGVWSSGIKAKTADLEKQVSNLQASVEKKENASSENDSGDISKVTKEALAALNTKAVSLADLVNGMNKAQYEKSVSLSKDEETTHFNELHSLSEKASDMFSDDDSKNLTLMPWYNGADDLAHQTWTAAKVYDFTGGSAPVYFECTGGSGDDSDELLAYATADYNFTDKVFKNLKITTTSMGQSYIVGTGEGVDTDANHVGQTASERQEEVQGDEVTGILNYIDHFMAENPDAGQDNLTEQEKQDQQDAMKAREEYKEKHGSVDFDEDDLTSSDASSESESVSEDGAVSDSEEE